MSVLELRQYTMVPGRRDDFAAIFDREFVETQEALGIEIVGQFRDLDRPDRYVWMRRFPNMESRRRSLEAFYGGPVWAEHADAANATMTEWHDVLLLTPAWDGADLEIAPRNRAIDGPLYADAPPLVVTIIAVPPDRRAALAAKTRARLAGNPALLGAYLTLPEPNTYPRLPIRDDASVLVLIGRGDVEPTAQPVVERVLRLQPTSRSRLA